MLILLPPSEAKAEGAEGAPPMDLATLSFPRLTKTRARISRALAKVSTRPDAYLELGLGPGLAGEVARNTRLFTAPALPAAQMYTGVLYAELGLPDLPLGARLRAESWIVVMSALYGPVRVTDRLAPYRLTISNALPRLGRMYEVWRPQVEPDLRAVAGERLIVDCRSSDYVRAWPIPYDLADLTVRIRVPGASHLAKKVRGAVAREICTQALDPEDVEGFIEPLSYRFDVEVAPRKRGADPWFLNVLPRRDAPVPA